MSNPQRAPLENKTAWGLAGGSGVLAIAWVVFNWLVKVPHPAQSGIPGVLAVIGGFVSSYMAKHTPRLEETLDTVLSYLGLNGHEAQTAGVNWQPAADVPAEAAVEPAVSQSDLAVTDPSAPAAVPDVAAPPATEVISPFDLGAQPPSEQVDPFNP